MSPIYDFTPSTAAVVNPAPFHGLTLTPRPRGLALVSSIVIHALAIVLLMGLSEYTPLVHEDAFNWAQYKVVPLRLHLSEPLYFKAGAADPSRPAAGAVPDRSVTAAIANKAASAAMKHPGSRNLQLPAGRELAFDAPTIIQPDLRPQLTVPHTLPPLAFWTRQAADLPKPPARAEVVVPGRTEPPATPPKLAALPNPAIPNRELPVADVNVALRQVTARSRPGDSEFRNHAGSPP